APAGDTVVRGYRSRIDGSVQPYAVSYPLDYGLSRKKRYRLDVVLHGRDLSLTEVAFLHRASQQAPTPRDVAFIKIDIYGRGNNAYRWAGEADVYEAVENFLAVETAMGRGGLIDRNRVVLRGYSMGGAGTWHLGLHRPDQFAALAPGAGFTTTHGFLADLPDKLPPYQEACLGIYDAADYAENAFQVPIIAYSGEKDPQLLAARTMEARMKPLGLTLNHLVAPDLAHQFPPEWQKKVLAEVDKLLEKERPTYPGKIRFVTRTLKYPGCNWVEILGMDQHYRQARVEAERTENGFTVSTSNIRTLRLGLWPGATREPISIVIDGTKLESVRPHASPTGDFQVYLDKQSGAWQAIMPETLAVRRLRRPVKTSGLTGPIDDAFTAPFLCVKGTGEPWHKSVGDHSQANLERFQAEWVKYFRGELPVKADTEVTAEDIATRNLILFGDPSSNRLIREVLPGLPLQWTRESVQLGKTKAEAGSHVPVLIYPSPLAVGKYVVLNSGHTFRAEDLQGSNARLYPRLGDYAVLALDAKDPLKTDVLAAGLFDDDWSIPAER
ncbi:MAG: prolyl oligopeptidase family serine peptidase, partial [Gemmataceae bacterium]